MPDKDYEPLLRQIVEDTATTRTNVSNLTEMMHDFQSSVQIQLAQVNGRIDEHGLRITSLEESRSSDRAVIRAGKWAFGSVLAIAALLGGSHAVNGKP